MSKQEKPEYFIDTNDGVIAIRESEFYRESRAVFVSDLGDDVMSLTLQRNFYELATGKIDDFGLSTFGNLYVSKAHARKFAKAILKATK